MAREGISEQMISLILSIVMYPSPTVVFAKDEMGALKDDRRTIITIPLTSLHYRIIHGRMACCIYYPKNSFTCLVKGMFNLMNGYAKSL